MSTTDTVRSSSLPGKPDGAVRVRRNAIDIAMEALTKPEVASLLTVGPLPDGIKSLLRIVADGEWRHATTEHVYRKHSAETVRAASAAFLSVVLFSRPSEPYRVLGLPVGAPGEDVRENKRLLLKWLHPDRNPRRREQEYLACVVEAAHAIENGHSKPPPPPGPAPSGGAKPGTVAQRPSSLKTTRQPAVRISAQAEQWRRIAVRLLGSIGRGMRRAAYALALLVMLLAAWRYVMDEPIGASVERYSKAVMAALAW